MMTPESEQSRAPSGAESVVRRPTARAPLGAPSLLGTYPGGSRRGAATNDDPASGLRPATAGAAVIERAG